MRITGHLGPFETERASRAEGIIHMVCGYQEPVQWAFSGRLDSAPTVSAV